MNPDLEKVLEREKAAAENPALAPNPSGPPIPMLMGELQMRADGLNVGVATGGQKVLQFVQGPTTVTVLIERDDIKKAIVAGLTGVQLA